VPKVFTASPIDVVVLKFRKIFPTGNRQKFVRYLPAPFQTVATARIAPKICQGQPPTFGAHCSRFHPNRFTFGRVIAERVKAVLLPPYSRYLHDRFFEPIIILRLRYRCKVLRSAWMSVCWSVRSYISKTARRNFTNFSVYVNCGQGSILLGRQCNKLCISGFVNDVMFSRPIEQNQERRCVSSSSTDGCTESEVCCIRLPCFRIWTDFFKILNTLLLSIYPSPVFCCTIQTLP